MHLSADKITRLYSLPVVLRLALIGIFGGLGSVVRSLIALAASKIAGEKAPWGTLSVNLLGCFLAGIVLYFSIDRPVLTANARAAIMTGFLGGLTTFSAFSSETVMLGRDRQWGIVALSVGANVFLGVAAVLLGRAAARLVSS